MFVWADLRAESGACRDWASGTREIISVSGTITGVIE